MKFEFGLWNYADADKYIPDVSVTVNEWKELGITLGCSYVTDGSEEQNARVKELISLCAAENIKLFVYDKRVYLNYYTGDRQKYLENVRAAVKDFGGYKNVVGFIFADEPTEKERLKMLDAIGIFKSVTNKIPFVNFSWCDGRIADYGSRENYSEVLCETVKHGLSYMANDRYSCMHAKDYEPNFKETGIDKYFADLNLFGGAARKSGVPYFVSLLSVGHWMYRTPDRHDIKWQLTTSFAHGANGIQWFFINQHRHADDYYDYPVTIYGEKTQIYHDLVIQSRVFKDKVLAPLDGYEFSRVFHIGKSYGGTPLLKKGDTDVFVWADHGMNGILAEFTKQGKKAYLIVNNDQQYPELFHTEYKNGAKDYRWLDAGGTRIVFCD